MINRYCRYSLKTQGHPRPPPKKKLTKCFLKHGDQVTPEVLQVVLVEGVRGSRLIFVHAFYRFF
jgi:hypothetical protein